MILSYFLYFQNLEFSLSHFKFGEINMKLNMTKNGAQARTMKIIPEKRRKHFDVFRVKLKEEMEPGNR